MVEKITVTSKELLVKEQDWKAMLSKAWEEFQAAVMETEKFSRHFSGEPVRKLQKEFVSLGREQSEAFRRLKTHIGKLGEIAAVYEEAERKNTNVTADN